HRRSTGRKSWQERSIGVGRRVSPADKSLKRPARRPGAEEKSSSPGGTFTVLPLNIELLPHRAMDCRSARVWKETIGRDHVSVSR
ncbi:MAG: hypothetical protein J7M32_05220, partial [Deltaproteobacteria bacterium]|nr:hypothetical protein [Deltaproteobacteria bacterium]